MVNYLLICVSLLAVNAFVPAPTTFRSISSSNSPSTQLWDGKSNIIRDRIKTVKNTKKITMAMKLVAAAKVRKAQDAVMQTRPFSETLQSVFGGLIARLGNEAADLPLLQQREIKKVTMVIISGDRGLCGGYNSYVIKKAEKRYNDLLSKGLEVNMIIVGKKANVYMTRRGYPIIKYYDCGQNPNAAEATAISEELLELYLSGETDSVELTYTRFISLIASETSARTLLPLSATGIESEGDEIFQLTSSSGDIKVEKSETGAAAPKEFPADMIFEQDPVQILNAILPLYLNGQILRTLQESVASELAARMQSMQAASDNAGELADELSMQYNRARQAAVTAELLEIVSGAAAIEQG